MVPEASVPSRLIEKLREAVDRAEAATADAVARSLNPNDTSPEERVTGRLEAYLEGGINSIGVVAGYSVRLHCDDFRWNYEDAPESKAGADIICIMTVTDATGAVVLEKFVLIQAKMDGGGTRPKVRTDDRWTPTLSVGKTALRDMHKSSRKLLAISDASYFVVYDESAIPVASARQVDGLRASLEKAPAGEHTRWVLTADRLSTILCGMPQCTHGDPDPNRLKLALSALCPDRAEDVSATHIWRFKLQKEEGHPVQLPARRRVPTAIGRSERASVKVVLPPRALEGLDTRATLRRTESELEAEAGG